MSDQAFQAVLPDPDLDDAQRGFAHRIRAFAADKLAPHARRIDEEEVFRAESVAELAAARVLGGPLRPENGGEGWSAVELALFVLLIFAPQATRTAQEPP